MHTEHTVVKMNESQPDVVMEVKETNISPRLFHAKVHTWREKGTEKSRADPRLHTHDRLRAPCLGTVRPTLPEGHMGHTDSGARLPGWDLGAPPTSCVMWGPYITSLGLRISWYLPQGLFGVMRKYV